MKADQFRNVVLSAFLQYAQKDTDKYNQLLQSLQVETSWLQSEKEWHTDEFNEKFMATFCSLFGDKAIEEATSSLYESKKAKLIDSAMSLFMTVPFMLSWIPRLASRVNKYNTYSYKHVSTGLMKSSGIFIQYYGDQSRKEHNKYLCQASQASIRSVFNYLDTHILTMTEVKCIQNGDEYCETHITWVNRLSFRSITYVVGLFFGGLVTHLGLDKLGYNVDYAHLVYFGLGMIIVYFTAQFSMRKKLKTALDFQQDTLTELDQSLQVQKELNQMMVDLQKRMNEQLNLANIGEISYSIIHDMASPIFMIEMGAQLVQDKINNPNTPAEDIRKTMKAIQNSSDKLTKLQNILRKSISKDNQSKKSEVNLGQVIADMDSLYSYFSRSLGIQLSKNIQVTDSGVMTYDGYLERCLINLIQNSINALRNHTSAKAITLSLTENSHQDLELILEDTGPGIPQDRLQNLHEKFGKSQASTGSMKGSGFGLYSIKRLIEDQGFHLDIQSSPAGSRFIIRIPKQFRQSYYDQSA